MKNTKPLALTNGSLEAYDASKVLVDLLRRLRWAVRGRGPSKINEDIFDQFIKFAKHIYKHNPSVLRLPDDNPSKMEHISVCGVCSVLEGRTGWDAEVADVFEAMRRYTLGGEKYSPALLERVDREIATELGAWI